MECVQVETDRSQGRRAEQPMAPAEQGLDQGAVYKVLANRIYLGEAVHKRVA